MKSTKKFLGFLIFSLFALVLPLVATPNVASAEVGDQFIDAPEEGWKRYDNVNGNLTLEGSFQIGSNSGRYMDTFFGSSEIGDKVKFGFKGTKIRLIGNLFQGEPGSRLIKIKIDDQTYTYSQYIPDLNGFENSQYVMFEKLDLEDKNHLVEIILENENTGLSVDAIDIDEDGELLPFVEEGWKRYDDVNSNLTLEGFVGGFTDFMYSYNETLTSSLEKGSKIKFNFKGSKIRLRSIKTAATSNSTIKIDDQTYTFSQHSRSWSFETFFEKLDLENKEHSVEITLEEDNYLSLDAIDIDEDGELLPYNENIEPEEPGDTNTFNLVATPGDYEVILTWDDIRGDEYDYFIVSRSTTPGGPYEQIDNYVRDVTFIDSDVENGVTYYYEVEAIIKSNILFITSNEASATPEASQVDEGGHAILTITLNTGLVKEYDVTMTTVEEFISWYENRANGEGSATFAIDTTDETGEFVRSTDYIIFDSVLLFEVDEY
ncbi:hypothetical protein V1503_06180 [Bacillus sp. SCS-151]|uniref:hypothetical protein n=1 Tax=Nanhaiella sioensis TaxID=3115293 RepID=UPI003979A4AD